MPSGKKEHLRIIEEFAKAHGWTVSLSNGNHLELTHPKIENTFFTSSTPSCYRVTLNAISKLKRAMREKGLLGTDSDVPTPEEKSIARGNPKPEMKTTQGERRQRRQQRLAKQCEAKPK